MEDIMKLKQNYSCPSDREICNSIAEYISTAESFRQENEQRLSEDERKIEELTRELSMLENKLQKEKSILDVRTQELTAEGEKLRSLKAERGRMAKNNHILERKCHKLRTLKPNQKDQALLELGKKKVDLYKQLTRIRWDYNALESAAKGCILILKTHFQVEATLLEFRTCLNLAKIFQYFPYIQRLLVVCDKKNYIRPFCYAKNIEAEELSDLLWHEIELSTATKFDNDGDKEAEP